MNTADCVTEQHNALHSADDQLEQNIAARNPPSSAELDAEQSSTAADDDSQLQLHLVDQRSQSISSDEPQSAGPFTPTILVDPFGNARQLSQSDTSISVPTTARRDSSSVRHGAASSDGIARERSRSPRDQVEYRTRSPTQDEIEDKERFPDGRVAALDQQLTHPPGPYYWQTETTYRDGDSSVGGTDALSIATDGGLAVEGVGRTFGAARVPDPADCKLNPGLERNEGGGDSSGGRYPLTSGILDPTGAIIQEACGGSGQRKPSGAGPPQSNQSVDLNTQFSGTGQSNAATHQTTTSAGRDHQTGFWHQPVGVGGQGLAASTTHGNPSQRRDDPQWFSNTDSRPSSDRATYQDDRLTPTGFMPQRQHGPPATHLDTLNAVNATAAQVSNHAPRPSRPRGFLNPQEAVIDGDPGGSDASEDDGDNGTSDGQKASRKKR